MKKTLFALCAVILAAAVLSSCEFAKSQANKRGEGNAAQPPQASKNPSGGNKNKVGAIHYIKDPSALKIGKAEAKAALSEKGKGKIDYDVTLENASSEDIWIKEAEVIFSSGMEKRVLKDQNKKQTIKVIQKNGKAEIKGSVLFDASGIAKEDAKGLKRLVSALKLTTDTGLVEIYTNEK